MDINFISRQNIDAIYDIINTDIVKNHNYNLDNEDKYKKIIKKYTKTIYGSLKNNKKYENILIHDFNNIVQNKSLPFIVIDLKDKRGGNTVKSSNTETQDNYSSGDNKNSFVKKSRKKPKKSTEIENANIFDTFSYNDINDNDNDNNNDNEKTFTNFLKNNESFNSHIKDANKKIKDNLNKILSMKSININNNTNNNNINKLETIIENKIGSKNDDLDGVLNNNDNENNNNLSDPSAFSVYDDDLSIKQTISNFYINQKDHSNNNKVETYEDEKYLPGLIKNIGEEAPIQPLLYQNSNQGNERITKQVIIIDSGAKPGGINDISSVTNIGTNPWYKFRVTLEEPLKIDKLCDVYLRNICIHGADDVNNLLYFVIDIDEINIINNSNNAFLKDKICVLNTVTTGTAASVFTKSLPTESFYIASVNPDKFSSFTITLTNENNEHADTKDNKTFSVANESTNRIMFELEFKNRIIRNEII